MYTYDDMSSSHAEMSDQFLIRQALAGDQHAFEILFCRYHPSLFHFICRTLHDREQAWDISQHVFLQLYRFLPRLAVSLAQSPNQSPLKSWLYRVALNRCIQEMRRKKPVLFSELEVENTDDEEWSLLDMLADPDPLPEQVAEFHDMENTLNRAIRSLPPKFRNVIILRYDQQLTFVEIGRTLNMPENTVKTYYMRARPRLRAALSS